MKFDYYHDTDSLYIDLSEKTSADSQEVTPGVVVDFDAPGNIVGIDIDRASKIIDLRDWRQAPCHWRICTSQAQNPNSRIVRRVSSGYFAISHDGTPSPFRRGVRAPR